MRKLAIYLRNPVTPYHPVVRVELVRHADEFQKASDDDVAVDITDHEHNEEIGAGWGWHSERGDFVKGD